MVEFITEPKVRKSKDVERIAAALEEPGVYVLFNGDVPHYAGRATNLRKRLLAHMRIGSRYGNLWDHVSMFIIADAAHRSAVESIVIASIGELRTVEASDQEDPRTGFELSRSGRGSRKMPNYSFDQSTFRRFLRFAASRLTCTLP
jgi:hypothetical protein